MSAASLPRSTAVSLEHVSFCYNETESEALRDINLSIRPGEFIVLTGESGCGKTTLTRTINGLIPLVYQGVLKGRVSVAEKPVTEWTSGGFGGNGRLGIPKPTQPIRKLGSRGRACVRL